MSHPNVCDAQNLVNSNSYCLVDTLIKKIILRGNYSVLVGQVTKRNLGTLQGAFFQSQVESFNRWILGNKYRNFVPGSNNPVYERSFRRFKQDRLRLVLELLSKTGTRQSS